MKIAKLGSFKGKKTVVTLQSLKLAVPTKQADWFFSQYLFVKGVHKPSERQLSQIDVFAESLRVKLERLVEEETAAFNSNSKLKLERMQLWQQSPKHTQSVKQLKSVHRSSKASRTED